MFNKLVKEKFEGMKELSYKIDHDNLIYYFKNNTAKILMIMVWNFLEKYNPVK